jgi:hypothetical protein
MSARPPAAGRFATRIRSRAGLERIFRERLSEPLHLNAISLFVALFGGVEAKTYFDLIPRQQFAFGVLHAARRARRGGLSRVKALEFGVAAGAGLLNMSGIASRVSKATGVEVDVVGFDGAVGLPRPRDHRDHPDLYTVGSFAMQDQRALIDRLPHNARLVVGPLDETVPDFLARLDPEAPIGFVSVDVDYYFSAVDALGIFDGHPELYLPALPVYFDDVWFEQHNPWCGELLAIEEFNEAHEFRKIAPFTALRSKRLFKNARWIDQMFTAHVLDHPTRMPAGQAIHETLRTSGPARW